MKTNIDTTSVEEEDESSSSKALHHVSAKSSPSPATESGGAAKPYERKRTANLENLIGNLKVTCILLPYYICRSPRDSTLSCVRASSIIMCSFFFLATKTQISKHF